MTKFLIASHGHLASGILSTLNIIVGNVKDVICIDAYTDGVDLIQQFNQFTKTVSKDETAIVFTDLKGGSVNREIFNIVNKNKLNNIKIITGFNIALILTLVLQKENLNEEIIKSEIENAKKQMELLEYSNVDESIDTKKDFLN